MYWKFFHCEVNGGTGKTITPSPKSHRLSHSHFVCLWTRLTLLLTNFVIFFLLNLLSSPIQLQLSRRITRRLEQSPSRERENSARRERNFKLSSELTSVADVICNDLLGQSESLMAHFPQPHLSTSPDASIGTACGVSHLHLVQDLDMIFAMNLHLCLI